MPVADLNDITDEEWARALGAMSEEDWGLVRQELELIHADLVRSRMEDARRLDSFWLPPRGPRRAVRGGIDDRNTSLDRLTAPPPRLLSRLRWLAF